MRFHARVGQSSVCDGVYNGVNDGFSECDVSTGEGTGEEDSDGEGVEDDGAGGDVEDVLGKTVAMVRDG